MQFVILLTLLAVSVSHGKNHEEFQDAIQLESPGKISESASFLIRERRQNTQVNTGNNAKQIMGGRRRRDVEELSLDDSLEPLQRESRQANTQVNTGNGATQIMGRKRREVELEEEPHVRERRQNSQINTGNGATQIMGGRKRRAAESPKNPEIGVNTPTFNVHVGASGVSIQNQKPLDRFRRQNTQVNTGHGATQIMGGRKRREADFEEENFETLNRKRRQNSHINTDQGTILVMTGRKRRETEVEEELEILDRQRRQNTQVNTGNHATQIMGRKRRQVVGYSSNTGNVRAQVYPHNVNANVRSPTGNHFSTSLNY